MKTGVFFHEEFKNKDWPVIGDKFRNFPEVLKDVLKLPSVLYFESKPVDEEILLNTHTHTYLQEVKEAGIIRVRALLLEDALRQQN